MAYKPTNDPDLIASPGWPELLWIPTRGQSKPRPRSTSQGQPYMPTEYMAWKNEVATLLPPMVRGQMIDHPVKLFVHFDTNRIGIQLKPLPNAVRPKHLGLNDLDNLVGGVMDALQDADVIVNDRMVYELAARVWI